MNIRSLALSALLVGGASSIVCAASPESPAKKAAALLPDKVFGIDSRPLKGLLTAETITPELKTTIALAMVEILPDTVYDLDLKPLKSLLTTGKVSKATAEKILGATKPLKENWVTIKVGLPLALGDIKTLLSDEAYEKTVNQLTTLPQKVRDWIKESYKAGNKHIALLDATCKAFKTTMWPTIKAMISELLNKNSAEEITMMDNTEKVKTLLDRAFSFAETIKPVLITEILENGLMTTVDDLAKKAPVLTAEEIQTIKFDKLMEEASTKGATTYLTKALAESLFDSLFDD
jgi:hypothetical protein